MAAIRKMTLLGCGEAGRGIARGLLGDAANSSLEIRAFDVRFRECEFAETARAIGMRTCADVGQAIAGADLVLSAVVSSAVVPVAEAAGCHVQPGQVYVDINSASPMTKASAAAKLPAGVAFIDAAVMDAVPTHGHRVPMLLAGPEAERVAESLSGLGMRVEAVSARIGGASTIKMLRSVMIKGFEALLLESLSAAHRYGVAERILASLASSFPGGDWSDTATYFLGRTAAHGQRRAAEMTEAAATLADMGLEPLMTEAAARRIRWAAERMAGKAWAPSGPAHYRDVLELLCPAAGTKDG